ncbi:Ras-2 protein [Apiospora arundinis]
MGPARDLFTGEIADTIRGFLRNSLQESNSFVTFTLFMVGKVPQKTKPTIMVVSDDKPRRKEAYDKIKESKILANYPGFEIGHCSVAAEHEDLCQLGTEDDESGRTGPYSEQNDHQRDPWQNSIAFSSDFPRTQRKRPFRIYFRSSVHGTSPSATCGGAFFRNGRLYLITTAHVMVLPQPPDKPDDQTVCDVQDESDDCEITGFDDWDSDAEDQILSSMTSSGSQTSSSAGSDSEEWLLDRTLNTTKSKTSGIKKRSPIAVLTTSKGAITGKPSSMPLYTRLPGTRDFQKLYCFYLDKPLSPGDCGSWVVAGDEQELVGFVVAGSPKTGMCLVCPARRAMEVFDSLLQQHLDELRSSLGKEPSFLRTAMSAHNASDQPVHSGDSQLVHRDNGPPSHSAHLGPVQVVDDDRVQREAAEGATHILLESSIQRPKGKQPTIPDVQLGLTEEEIQLLRYHQIQANSSSTSRAASSASSQGQLLLDASSLAALSRHLDLLMHQKQQRIEDLSKQSSMVTVHYYDDAGNLVDTTDSYITNSHDIMRRLDKIELDLYRTQHISDVVRGFRQESDKIGLQGPDTSGSQRVPDAVADADTQRGKGPSRDY